MRSMLEEIMHAAIAQGKEETLYGIFEFLENHQESESKEQMWRDARIRLEEIAGRALA